MAPCAPANITTQMHLVRASVVVYSSDHVVITMVIAMVKMKRCIQEATEMRKRRCASRRGKTVTGDIAAGDPPSDFQCSCSHSSHS